MIKFVRTDNASNYFIDINGNKVSKYDSSQDLKLIMKLDDGSTLEVDSSEITQLQDGQIIVNYSKDKFIIDDGHQNSLIRSGYIVMDDYDIEHLSPNGGVSVRNKLFAHILKTAQSIDCVDNIVVGKNNQSLCIIFHNDNFEYMCIIDTINNIVTKNQNRMKNQLPLFQFVKEMDKYGTMYISLFCKCKDDSTETIDHKEKYFYGQKIITDFIESMNGKDDHVYRFEKVINKRRLNYCEGA